MVDVLGQPPMVVESMQIHTPPDPHAKALAHAQEPDEELLQRQQSQTPPALERSAQHAAPRACNPASGARGHARQVQHNILDRGNDRP